MNASKFEYVIARMIFDKKYLGRIIDNLDPKMFQNQDIRLFVDKIVEFYLRNNDCPNKTEILVSASEEDAARLEKIFSALDGMDVSYNDDELMRNTETFMRERAVYNALVEVTENLADDKKKKLSEAEILSKFSKACNISIIDDNGWNYIDDIKKFTSEITKPYLTISTGYKWLDRMLNGGWLSEGKALYIFTAGTNVGKSILLGNFAVNSFLDGKCVVLITLEMSELMYVSRMAAKINAIDVNLLKNNVTKIEANAKCLKSQGAGTLIVKEFPTRATTVSRISAYIDQLGRTGIRPDLIIVDYLNLLSAGQHVNNTYEDGKILSEQLRALTYQTQCPCITATQLNREGSKKENADMTSVSESFASAMTGDFLATLWSTDEDKQNGIMHMGIQKSRFEKNWGVCNLKIDYPTMTISEIEDDEITEEMMPDTTVQKSVVEDLEDWMA